MGDRAGVRVVEDRERHQTWLRRTEDDRWVARCTCGWGTPESDTVASVRQLADEHEIQAKEPPGGKSSSHS